MDLCNRHGGRSRPRLAFTITAEGGVPATVATVWPCLCALILIHGEQQRLLLVRWCSFVVLPRVERCAC